MGGKIRAMGSLAHLEVKGCMPEVFLNACAQQGIEIVSARKKGDFTIAVLLPSRNLMEAERLAEAKGCEVKIYQKGRVWRGFIRRRLFPAVFALCLVGLLFWSKFYVWEIRVSGNENVSNGEILSALEECGVESGAFWPGFSSDNIRSEVLARMGELSWITVNMQGSCAEVYVVERKERPEMVFEGGPASIRAEKEGFVRKVQALAGQSAVKSGDVVSKGDVLISGVLESSFSRPSFTRAQGKVVAETNTEYLAIMPEKASFRRYTGEGKHRYALIIGNNRINFYSDSSISDVFCDKIISVWDLEVSGLFKLPVSIVRESIRVYESEPSLKDQFEAGEALRQCLYAALNQNLNAGELLSEKLSYSHSGGLYTASLRVRSLEDIGALSPISEMEKSIAYAKYTEKADDE